MNRALIAKALPVSDILTDDPNAIAAVLVALPAVMEKKPAAQKAVLIAVEKDRAKLLAFAKDHPELSKKIAEQVIREAVKDQPTAEKMLRVAKIIDDTPDGIGDTKKQEENKKSEEPKKVEDKGAPDVKKKSS